MIAKAPGFTALALLALALGAAALVLFLALTVWFLLSGERPV